MRQADSPPGRAPGSRRTRCCTCSPARCSPPGSRPAPAQGVCAPQSPLQATTLTCGCCRGYAALDQVTGDTYEADKAPVVSNLFNHSPTGVISAAPVASPAAAATPDSSACSQVNCAWVMCSVSGFTRPSASACGSTLQITFIYYNSAVLCAHVQAQDCDHPMGTTDPCAYCGAHGI